MKKRTAFIGAILSLIPLGQPLIIKTGVFLSSSVVMLYSTEKVNAENAIFYFKKADEKVKQKDFNGALLYINKAIRINSNVSEFYGSRAAIYGMMGNYESACADMRKAIAMGDNIVLGYYDRFVKQGVC